MALLCTACVCACMRACVCVCVCVCVSLLRSVLAKGSITSRQQNCLKAPVHVCEQSGSSLFCNSYWTQSLSDRSLVTQCKELHHMPGKPLASNKVTAPCRCAQALELTQMAKKGAHFRCPQHYCAVCRKSGDGVDMVKCIRCPTAYHSSCMPKDIQRLLPHAKVWPRHHLHIPCHHLQRFTLLAVERQDLSCTYLAHHELESIELVL